MKHFLLIVILFLTACISKSSNIEKTPPHTSGYVKFMFDIDKYGSPLNIKMKEEHPNGAFDDATLIAIRKWRFKVKYVDGLAVVQHNMIYTMEFKLDE